MAKSTSSTTDRRKARVRRAIAANAVGRPRLSVFRSSKQIYAQVIDDEHGRTLASASTLEKAMRDPNFFIVKSGSEVSLDVNGLPDESQRPAVIEAQFAITELGASFRAVNRQQLPQNGARDAFDHIVLPDEDAIVGLVAPDQ